MSEQEPAQNEGPVVTPRRSEYWRLTYRELTMLPEWFGLSTEDRAQKLLEKIEAKLHEADVPPQSKALLGCSEDQRLEAAREMITEFEDAGGRRELTSN